MQMTAVWPWLVLAGLGAFHGLNPAMGWLFAVALGLHRNSRADVLVAILPIAIGHFLSVALVASLFLASGFAVDTPTLARIAGVVLIGWAAYHALWGHRHRVRFGMQVNLLGLGAWSFLMATAHGAGLMLIPALMPICFPPEQQLSVANAAGAAIAGVLVHSVAMLATTAAIAIAVYDWIGLAILRSAWINLDLAWTLALAATGAYLLLS
jgi:hypothetical protein